jgi:amino acid transporter
MSALPPTPAHPAAGFHSRLTGRLGPVAIVFMVVAAAAPLTVVAGTVPIGIAAGNGSSFPATYLVCTGILLLFAAGFTAMTRHVDQGGAFSAYVTKGLGRPAGAGAAFVAVVTYAAVQLAVYGFVGVAISGIVPGPLGSVVPWWAWSLVVMLGVGMLGYRHIELSGKVLGVLLVAEVLIVLVMNIAVVAHGGGSEGFATTALDPFAFWSGAPGIALIFAVAGFIGFEATAIFRDEARDPDRTIPRATYGALLLIGGFYAFSAWALVSWWGDSGALARAAAGPETMVAETATATLGAAVGDLVELLLVTSIFAAILSFHNVLARYLYYLADLEVLPARLLRTHARHASPHLASLSTSVIGAVLLLGCVAFGLDPVLEVFAWFAGVAVVGVLALMFTTTIAVLVFFRRHPALAGRWSGRIAPALGLLGLGWLLLMSLEYFPLLIGGSTALAIVLGLALVAAAVGGALIAHLQKSTSVLVTPPQNPVPNGEVR